MVIAFALTLALIVLAFAFAGTSDWILMVILSIDLPVYVLLGIAEWIARTRT